MSGRKNKTTPSNTEASPATDDTLDARLQAAWLGFAGTERAIAKYLVSRKEEIPFETGATIAAAAGVSEASVARFVRRLGYEDLKDMKRRARQRPAAPDLDDAEARFRIGGPDGERFKASLEMEQAALAGAYSLATGPTWQRIVDLLCERAYVNCVAFQAMTGMALDFSTRLRWIRSGVRFAENITGTYSEILADNVATSCVVLVDTAEYASTTFRLCKEITRHEIPLIVVTDKYSHWAREFTELALEVSTHVDLYWDSTSAISCILNLLTHAVAARLNVEAHKRMEELEGLAGHFGAFRPFPKHSALRHRKG